MLNKRYFLYIPKNKIKINKNIDIVDLRRKIELLQEELYSKISEKQSLLDEEVYNLSVELDLLINEYMDQKFRKI